MGKKEIKKTAKGKDSSLIWLSKPSNGCQEKQQQLLELKFFLLLSSEKAHANTWKKKEEKEYAQ